MKDFLLKTTLLVLVSFSGLIGCSSSKEKATEGIKYTYVSNTTSYTVNGYTGTKSDVYIPSEYDDGTNGKAPVTKIVRLSFNSASVATTVHLPKSILEIANEAFSGATALKDIIVNENNEKFSSIDGILYNKDQTTLLSCAPAHAVTNFSLISSVTTIKDYAFANQSNLTSFSGNSVLTSISNYAFYKCASLTTVDNISHVSTIWTQAFFGCNSLSDQHFSIPDSVTTIKVRAFGKCTSIDTIIIPDTVTTLEISAFAEAYIPTCYVEATEKPGGWATGWDNDIAMVYWYSATTPSGSGDYWHYEEDGTTPTIWNN